MVHETHQYHSLGNEDLPLSTRSTLHAGAVHTDRACTADDQTSRIHSIRYENVEMQRYTNSPPTPQADDECGNAILLLQ